MWREKGRPTWGWPAGRRGHVPITIACSLADPDRNSRAVLAESAMRSSQRAEVAVQAMSASSIACGAGMRCTALRTGTLGREVAVQDLQVAGLLDGLVHREDDLREERRGSGGGRCARQVCRGQSGRAPASTSGNMGDMVHSRRTAVCCPLSPKHGKWSGTRPGSGMLQAVSQVPVQRIMRNPYGQAPGAAARRAARLRAGPALPALPTCWPSFRPGQVARFSARVLPVTVRQLPSMRLCWCRYLSTAGVPPTCVRGRAGAAEARVRRSSSGLVQGNAVQYMYMCSTCTGHAQYMCVEVRQLPACTAQGACRGKAAPSMLAPYFTHTHTCRPNQSSDPSRPSVPPIVITLTLPVSCPVAHGPPLPPRGAGFTHSPGAHPPSHTFQMASGPQ